MKKQILGIIFILALQLACAQQSKKTVDYDLNFDDSKYNDSATVEFCLQDSKNRNFCLYHNIRKVKDFDYEKYDIVADWSKGSDIIRWEKQETEDFSVTWSHDNGVIVRLITTSPEWQTKRGVKVGDPITKVEKLYGPDSNFSVWNPKTQKFDRSPYKKGKKFLLIETEEGYGVNAANMLEEEMMTISFENKNGKISKITIFIGD